MYGVGLCLLPASSYQRKEGRGYEKEDKESCADLSDKFGTMDRRWVKSHRQFVCTLRDVGCT